MTTYKCPHCQRDCTVTETFAEVCQCREAVQAELELKERTRQLASSRTITFEEARKRSKRRDRKL